MFVLHTYVYAVIGDLKPKLKDLHNIVIPKVSARWYDLAIQLVDDSQLPKLEEIRRAYGGDYQGGCVEMLKYWLQVDKKATWDKIIDALKAPGLQFLNESQNVEEEVKGMEDFDYF